MIKFTIITFFLSILVSLLIFKFYHSPNIDIKKEDINKLGIEENNIINRCGEGKEKFRFCSYPEFDFGSQISWDKNTGHSDNECLKISFKDNKKYYLGVHLHLTLNLEPYLEKGILEFWLKDKENYPLVKNVDLYLKEGPIIQRIVGISLPMKVNKDWQKISLPLNKFSLIKENNKDFKNKDKEFHWAIQEVLFSVTPIVSSESIELLIDDLRIIDNQKIIYEIF